MSEGNDFNSCTRFRIGLKIDKKKINGKIGPGKRIKEEMEKMEGKEKGRCDKGEME